MELFEQSEKTLINRNLLKPTRIARECLTCDVTIRYERLSAQLLTGSVDEVLRSEYQRLSERLQIAEQALEKAQKVTLMSGCKR